MACMKCGKDCEESQVFCQECLAVMERYPVKPGTTVQLPKRAPRSEKKVLRTTPLKEVVQQQRATIRRMRLALAILFLALCLVSALLYFKIYYEAGVFTPETFETTQAETVGSTGE